MDIFFPLLVFFSLTCFLLGDLVVVFGRGWWVLFEQGQDRIFLVLLICLQVAILSVENEQWERNVKCSLSVNTVQKTVCKLL